MRHRVAALAGLILATAGAAAPAHAQQRPVEPGRPFAGGAMLSDERLLTRWAYPRTAAAVHGAPMVRSTRVGRLRFRTEDGYPEVYVGLKTAVDSAGGQWVQVRLPKRPNGRRGWVPRAALGNFRIVRHHLRINRRTLTATLFDAGRQVWQSRIGIGKRGTPTPRGTFYVRELLRVSRRDTIYGPYAFGTSAYSVLSDWPNGGVVGIHGTNQPQLIPGRPSHGCVRVPNRAIRRLARLMPIGTPIHIL
ncbi:MAG: L,D-transpeptidase [Solirubrobacterales bacterium]|nr:L,D-transpeptidase [Solirubrobacterales bacterium]